ncbi:phosphatidate cytidylyltransferase [Micromonospora pattaloongensis]|uniref:Phosphatidate cytidylyltransferase n=1 Tax=Micromonospora pattaloongensis TaxID=405436 RepID=A0A1H3KP42_9ACTN|nr:phosphatidate cytidylyltransferase [Micromonospora pattaloongensis]SDY53816.1 phosphatidate cytidylyltransferase [Micromonospora pattaloongensis]
MSYPDPYGGQKRDVRPGARHGGAAPDPYPPHRGYDADAPYPGTGRDSFPPGAGATPHPRAVDVPGGLAEAETAGWPLLDADPAPPARRAPGRRRASRHRRADHDQPRAADDQAQPTDADRSAGPNGADKGSTPSRAGRNLPAAIGVGVALVALILGSLFFWPPAFLAVLVAAVSIGIWEMARAVRAKGAQPPLVPLLGGGVVMLGMAWWAGPDALSLGLIVTVLACLVWRLGDGPARYQRDISAATLIAVYVPFLAGFAALLAVQPDGDLRILVTLAAVVLSDTGGYAAGVFYGRHPMAPSVSPKKSWEGFGGSLVAAALGSALLLWLLLDVAPWWGALFGLAVSVAAVLGDLGESMIKRDLGIKDMSDLLPGHGGLMDRLDSILFALPTAYLLLALLAPVG